jgi:hypothetical protein
MADATDLKSVDRKVVWVRLPPSAPILISLLVAFVVRSLPYSLHPPQGFGPRMRLR